MLIALAGMFCGLGSALLGGDFKLTVPGIPFPVFETISIFTIPLAILAVFTNVTAFTRLREAKEAIELKERREAGLR
ncbi:hypothetical protein [Rufibacter ruber]|uniref:hypothetical protein n=1 Tax=Rufibacter ruber TaxID=1783499 RepID=UPI000AE9C9D7|nr:hypothetical protein [Rufibacter ruber]